MNPRPFVCQFFSIKHVCPFACKFRDSFSPMEPGSVPTVAVRVAVRRSRGVWFGLYRLGHAVAVRQPLQQPVAVQGTRRRRGSLAAPLPIQTRLQAAAGTTSDVHDHPYGRQRQAGEAQFHESPKRATSQGHEIGLCGRLRSRSWVVRMAAYTVVRPKGRGLRLGQRPGARELGTIRCFPPTRQRATIASASIGRLGWRFAACVQ